MLESTQSHSAIAPWQAAGYSLRDIVEEDEQSRRAELEARIAYHQQRIEREEQADGYVRRWREEIQAKTRDRMAARSKPIHERRLRIARLLVSGPMMTREIMAATGLPQNLIYHVVQHPWFRREGFWHVALTDEGKRVLGEKE